VAETAIVVIVPEAEPAVGRWQRQHTRAGADGMPPHVTLLIPFADSESLPLAEVGEVLGGFAPFAFALTEPRRFVGPDAAVLWLAPEPAALFVALTEALARRFPDYQPYGGVFDEIVPHLSVAVSADEGLLGRIERDIAPVLPIAATANNVSFVHRVGGRWALHSTLALRDP
jgi:2'-5' RNA ligase superfamily